MHITGEVAVGEVSGIGPSLSPAVPAGAGSNGAHLVKPSLDNDWERITYRMRLAILEQSKRANVGHIGSALSVADIVCALFGGAMNLPDPNDPTRDRFVLSKGHASLALYCALHLKGWMTREELDTYCGDGSLLGVHPERDLTGVDFTTGSLGQGLALATGSALAAKIQGTGRRTFVLVSDAECNEGSTWESVMFAAQHQLGNLIAIVDLNGQQALGYTDQVLDLAPMRRHWESFGWDVHEVDGHDPALISETIASLDTVSGRPHVLIARTTFGKGVSYMESQIRWHYWPMSDEQYEQALDEISR